MRLLRVSFLSLALAGAATSIALVPSDANASVMIAVGFDALVKDADAVAVASASDASSVWEDGRIVTYTRVKVEETVAGDPPKEVWVRTLGGVVGKVGQLVDGEPVLTPGKSWVLFLRKFKTAGTFEVSARAQGQFPVVLDEISKQKKIIRNANAGMLLPPKTAEGIVTDGVTPQSAGAAGGGSAVTATKIRLAGDVLHDRALTDVTREIATAWKQAHPVK